MEGLQISPSVLSFVVCVFLQTPHMCSVRLLGVLLFQDVSCSAALRLFASAILKFDQNHACVGHRIITSAAMW